jgi:hypothetical protein
MLKKGYAHPLSLKVAKDSDLRPTLEKRENYLTTYINSYIPAYNDTDDDLYVQAGVRVVSGFTPTADEHLVPKSYSDSQLTTALTDYLLNTTDSLTGHLTLHTLKFVYSASYQPSADGTHSWYRDSGGYFKANYNGSDLFALDSSGNASMVGDTFRFNGETSNDYIYAAEANNDMRFLLDGALVFEINTGRRVGYWTTTGFSVGNASNTAVGWGIDGDVAYLHVARDAVGTNLIIQKVGSPGFNSTFASWYYDSTLSGSVYATSASVTVYSTSSDYRLKKNIRPIEDALVSLKKVRPVEFEWIEDDVYSEGYLAHEAQEVIPWGVSGEKDGEEFQTMDASKLIPRLHAAILELEERVRVLEEKVNFSSI